MMKIRKNFEDKMNRVVLKLSIPFLLIFLTVLACDSTEGAGSGGTEPGSTAPKIVEGFMCAGVFEGNPVGIDNDFFLDENIYIWLSWENVVGTHEVKILWVDPNENILETKKSFQSAQGTLTTYFWIDTTKSAPVGQWLAEVYWDGEFVRSYTFWLNPVD